MSRRGLRSSMSLEVGLTLPLPFSLPTSLQSSLQPSSGESSGQKLIWWSIFRQSFALLRFPIPSFRQFLSWAASGEFLDCPTTAQIVGESASRLGSSRTQKGKRHATWTRPFRSIFESAALGEHRSDRCCHERLLVQRIILRHPAHHIGIELSGRFVVVD